MPEILTGLKMEDFIHPEDIKATAAISKVPGMDKLLRFVEDQYDNTITRVEMMGYCVRLTEDLAPRFFEILRHVCRILDYDRIPEVFCSRSYSIDVTISGADHPIIGISDYLLNDYDESMLYFLLGRVITRFKAGYMKYFTASDLILQGTGIVGLISEPLRIALANWRRKAEMTADRGGLLACQNMQTAGRFFMHMAGMPAPLTRDVKVRDYLNACAVTSDMAKTGKTVLTLGNESGWNNDRLRELNNWYAAGSMYDIIERYAD